ncbi:MAG: CDP-alcohol phosphatidyltransferase family protein [Candidatus Heimdallarchaeota archaeon]|nr:CDP-alcohol phosphatidyltransferase family protein [Candidatus Heimdallarchaeota archaeon]
MVASQFRGPFTKLMKPIYELFAKLGIHPNMITIIGLGISIFSGWAFAEGEYLIAAFGIFLSGFADVLDGGVARVGGYVSSEGAFLDSVADRLGESAIYMGLIIGFIDSKVNQVLGLSLLVLSFSISYLRARGEGLGIELAGIGIMERAERMGGLMLAALLAEWYGDQVFLVSIIVILGLVALTVVHRFFKVYDALRIQTLAESS